MDSRKERRFASVKADGARGNADRFADERSSNRLRPCRLAGERCAKANDNRNDSLDENLDDRPDENLDGGRDDGRPDNPNGRLLITGRWP